MTYQEIYSTTRRAQVERFVQHTEREVIARRVFEMTRDELQWPEDQAELKTTGKLDDDGRDEFVARFTLPLVLEPFVTTIQVDERRDGDLREYTVIAEKGSARCAVHDADPAIRLIAQRAEQIIEAIRVALMQHFAANAIKKAAPPPVEGRSP